MHHSVEMIRIWCKQDQPMEHPAQTGGDNEMVWGMFTGHILRT